jgi:hypothetical protein
MGEYRVRVGPYEGDPEVDVWIDDPHRPDWLARTLSDVMVDVGGLQTVTILSDGELKGKSAEAEVGAGIPPSLRGLTAFA